MQARLAIFYLLFIWIASSPSSCRAAGRVLLEATPDSNFGLFAYGSGGNIYSQAYDDSQDDFPEEWDSIATRNQFKSENARTDDEYSKLFKSDNAGTGYVYSKDGFVYEAVPKGSTFNVMDYGASGNGRADDTQAFLKAWGAVCGTSAQGIVTLIVPEGKTFLLKTVTFEGPCKAGNVNFKIQGNIVAPNYNGLTNKVTWIQFHDVQGLIMNGGGQIDGNGAVWWKLCGDKDTSECNRPTSVNINSCRGLQLSGLTFVNSPRNHLSINRCDGGQISNLVIRAPDESPNTDGINLSETSKFTIESSLIATGDDCVAISSGTSSIKINGIKCGPGHGISIGSLGEDGAYSQVEGVEVRNCSFSGTQNGVRIKTWQGGKGYARNITFEDITCTNTRNPIIINQNYEEKSSSAMSVQVSNVIFRNIRGTSADEKAITLDCARNGCRNILFEKISLNSFDPSKKASSYCMNAIGRSVSSTPSVPCLSQ